MGSRHHVHIEDTCTTSVPPATAVLLLVVISLATACSSSMQFEPAATAIADIPESGAATSGSTSMTTDPLANTNTPVENQIPDNGSAGDNKGNAGDTPVEVADGSTAGVTDSGPVACTASDASMQERMLSLINAARAQARNCGNESFAATSPLSWDAKLLVAAKAHSMDMTSHNFFSHTGSDGSDISARVSATEYNWDRVGENIAAGQRSAAETVNGWLESEGHCKNLMNAEFEEVAVACIEDRKADYGRYWTNVLGRRF